jgi:hypothetical protein
MRTEPAIDRADLAETVRSRYGLIVEGLTFVPVGYAAACYALGCAGGERRFLKLWPDTIAGRAVATRLDVVLPLTRALVDRRLVTRVPAPLPTRDGALRALFHGAPFAVFPFLPGHAPAPWSDWPASQRDEFARTVAAIHQATPALADVLPPRETFAIPFEADLRRGLVALASIGPGARPGLLALRDSVLPRRDEVLSQLARLHRLQGAVQDLSGSFVLCHTDLGGDNLLVDDEGRFSVLDWDDAIVAPPEHDLHAALGDGFGRFLAVYQAAGGARSLRLDQFAFSLLRRYLGDMAARLSRLLEEDTTAQEDAELLAGIDDWGFTQWADFDQTLAAIAAALDRRDASPLPLGEG